MTEEIIIDGVDVAGCEHYCEKINTGSGVIQNPLKQGFCLHNITGLQNADIYFRMLTFPKCREQSNCYYKQLKRLEQENKELKKDVQLFKCLDTFGESECHCACRCLGNEFCEDADKKINSFRSALEEIQKAIKSYDLNVDNGVSVDTLYTIRKIINEVLNPS